MKKAKWQRFENGTYVNFIYTNHENKREKREAIYLGVDYGTNSYYAEPQFFLRCKAIDRDMAERSFAISKIEDIQKTDMTW